MQSTIIHVTKTLIALMNKLDKVTLAALGEVRNTRLAVMLDLAPFIAQCLNSGDVAASTLTHAQARDMQA